MNEFRNIEYFVKEFTLKSGEKRYQPWVKFEQSGLLWGWNKYEAPLYFGGGFLPFDLLVRSFQMGGSFDYFDTENEARTYIINYNEWYLIESKNQYDNTIIDSKII